MIIRHAQYGTGFKMMARYWGLKKLDTVMSERLRSLGYGVYCYRPCCIPQADIWHLFMQKIWLTLHQGL